MDESKKMELLGLLMQIRKLQYREQQMADLEPHIEAFLKMDPADVDFDDKEFKKAYRELMRLWPKRR